MSSTTRKSPVLARARTYSFTTNQLTNAQTLGYITGAGNARILAFTARFQF